MPSTTGVAWFDLRMGGTAVILKIVTITQSLKCLSNNRCLRCGYDNTSSSVCPECGLPKTDDIVLFFPIGEVVLAIVSSIILGASSSVLMRWGLVYSYNPVPENLGFAFWYSAISGALSFGILITLAIRLLIAAENKMVLFILFGASIVCVLVYGAFLQYSLR